MGLPRASISPAEVLNRDGEALVELPRAMWVGRPGYLPNLPCVPVI